MFWIKVFWCVFYESNCLNKRRLTFNLLPTRTLSLPCHFFCFCMARELSRSCSQFCLFFPGRWLLLGPAGPGRSAWPAAGPRIWATVSDLARPREPVQGGRSGPLPALIPRALAAGRCSGSFSADTREGAVTGMLRSGQ